MGRSDGVDDGTRRRTVLKLLSVAAGAQLIPWAGADQVADQTFSVVQGDRCIPVTPIVGDESVDEMYDWREDETHYSSAGTMDLQRQDTSILFLYVGPDGLSLVVVHGHYQNHDSDGGSVSMSFTGLPEAGEWVVEDDNYDGSENYDNWNHESTRSVIDWTWRFGRTDGGAFRGLKGDFEIQIEPAFNDASHFGDQHYEGDILEWQVLSGDRDDPDRTSLALDQPITLQVGGCDAGDQTEDGDGGGSEEDDGTTEEDGSENTDEGDGEGEDEGGDARTDVVVDEDTDGNIETDGSVIVEAGVEVDGNVAAGGSVDVKGDGEVNGNIAAGDGVSVGSESEVDGNVDASGDVSVGPDGEIDGNVESGGTVSVRSDSEIDGNVTGARVEVADSAEVDGEIEGEEEAGGRRSDSDDDSEDRQRTKHEKQQQKHRKKHEKRQRKHEKEEEKKERKHRKKQRKHEKKEEKKERKHRKKQRKHDKGNSAGIGDTLDDVTGLLDGDD